MRWVEQCRIYPGRCSVLPQLGGGPRNGPYVDTLQTNASGERIYVSQRAVQVMAESLGYQRPGDQSAAVHELGTLRTRVAELEQQIAENEQVVKAANLLLDVKAAV